MSVKPPSGIVCIINNFFKGQVNERRGSEKDVAALRKLFCQLNWEFFEQEFHEDLRCIEMDNLMKRLVDRNDMIPRFVFVMSHGDRTKLFDGNNVPYDPFQLIVRHFSTKNAPHLENVVKLLVIQSCRGTKEQLCWQDDANPTSAKMKNVDGIFKNTFLAQSTIPNYKSVRNVYEGTPYIQNLCGAFEKNFKNLNIVDMFMDIAKRVKNSYHPSTRTTFAITPEFRILGCSSLHKDSLAAVCKQPVHVNQQKRKTSEYRIFGAIFKNYKYDDSSSFSSDCSCSCCIELSQNSRQLQHFLY